MSTEVCLIFIDTQSESDQKGAFGVENRFSGVGGSGVGCQREEAQEANYHSHKWFDG